MKVLSLVPCLLKPRQLSRTASVLPPEPRQLSRTANVLPLEPRQLSRTASVLPPGDLQIRWSSDARAANVLFLKGSRTRFGSTKLSIKYVKCGLSPGINGRSVTLITSSCLVPTLKFRITTPPVSHTSS